MLDTRIRVRGAGHFIESIPMSYDVDRVLGNSSLNASHVERNPVYMSPWGDIYAFCVACTAERSFHRARNHLNTEAQ